MLRLSLCDYSDAYILFKGTITVTNTAAQGQPNNWTNKKVILKNCAPFTKCISKINNTQVDDTSYIDAIMPKYNLIEYSDSYSKTFGILSRYCRDEPAVDNNGAFVDFAENNADTNSLKIKEEITNKTGDNGTKMLK